MELNMAGQDLEKVRDIMELTQDDVFEMHKFLFKYKNDTRDLLPFIIQSDLKPNQKMFLSYVRGICQELRSRQARMSQKDNRKYFDQVDAFEQMSEGFNEWNIGEVVRVVISSLQTMMITALDRDEIAETAMQISDEFCRFSENYKNIK